MKICSFGSIHLNYILFLPNIFFSILKSISFSDKLGNLYILVFLNRKMFFNYTQEFLYIFLFLSKNIRGFYKKELIHKFIFLY